MRGNLVGAYQAFLTRCIGNVHKEQEAFREWALVAKQLEAIEEKGKVLGLPNGWVVEGTEELVESYRKKKETFEKEGDVYAVLEEGRVLARHCEETLKTREEELRHTREQEKTAEELRRQEEAKCRKREQEEAEKCRWQERKAGETKTIALPGGAKMKMVWCPPGTFLMGSPEEEKGRNDDESQHQVTLTHGFWMAKTPVTQMQWKSVMGSNPSEFTGNNLPVENVSWNDAKAFCRKCQRAGMALQLPTEAQWEYACRAGSTGRFAGTGKLPDMGWFQGNSEGQTHPVGQKKPNAWGLYDMHGNVWEWCADWFADYPSYAVTDPAGNSSGSERVVRGGGWCDSDGEDDFESAARYNRSAMRGSFAPETNLWWVGFRPVSNLSE